MALHVPIIVTTDWLYHFISYKHVSIEERNCKYPVDSESQK